MEAATPISLPAVRVTQDRVVIDHLVVDDQTTVELAREHADPAALLTDAIEVGARILARELVGAQADVVKAEFATLKEALDGRTKALADRLDQKVDEAFGPGDGTVARELAKHFGDESSVAVQHKVKAVLDAATKEMREELRKSLMGEGEDNPLAKFHRVQVALAKAGEERHSGELRAVREQIQELKLALERERAEKAKLEEVAAERERGSAKGRTFEEAVAAALDEIAVAQGDDCEAVGDQTEGTGKVGDVVVGIDGCHGPVRGRIVFEAKNKKLSRPEALRELDKAMDQRNADFAVLVVAGEDKLPAKTLGLREFNGDKLIVAYDPEEGSTLALQVAYSLARARVLLRRADAEGIDGAAVTATAERALQCLTEVVRIKQQLTASKTAVDKAAEIVDSMSGSVRAHLSEIQALVAAPAAGEEPAQSTPEPAPAPAPEPPEPERMPRLSDELTGTLL